MARQFEAVYEQGVLRLLEPLILTEHQRVHLTLEERTEQSIERAPNSMHERREELQWLANESGPYAGEWVALNGACLIAHGERLRSVREAAKTSGVEPLFARVPRDKHMPFGGS